MEEGMVFEKLGRLRDKYFGKDELIDGDKYKVGKRWYYKPFFCMTCANVWVHFLAMFILFPASFNLAFGVGFIAIGTVIIKTYGRII